MPYINISIYKGHPADRKQRIAQKISDIINEETKVPYSNIWVTFSEIPCEDWCVNREMQAGVMPPQQK